MLSNFHVCGLIFVFPHFFDEWFVVWPSIQRSFPVRGSVLKLERGSGGVLNIKITQLGFLRFQDSLTLAVDHF
jgi:hypothetical protein